MVAAGAIIGAVLGGNGNAARSPGTLENPSEAAAAPEAPAASAAQNSVASESAQAAAPRAPELAPAAAVAMRFPPRWHAAVASAPQNSFALQTMAYAVESAAGAAASAPASSGYQLASVDPASAAARAPLPPKRAKPSTRNTLLFNDAQLASIKSRLNLSPQQEQYWPQVEQALRAISWKLATQQDPKRPVRGQQLAMIDPNSPEVARLKSAAFPLIMSLRAEQKEEARQLAHTMGLSKVAAMF